jgi:RimJ/RimL family protein N-acetyltransferase
MGGEVKALKAEGQERVRSICAELADTHLHVSAILNGDCPGEVFVDDIPQPRVAYLVSGDGHYLAGSASNRAFNRALNAALPRDHYFVLFCDPERWGEALPVVLEGTYAVQAERCYYTLSPHSLADWQGRVPAGFSMERINHQLLARNLTHGDQVLDRILDEWRLLDAFLERGLGTCLVHNAQIVSWSLLDYVQGDRCEMGVHTIWGQRRRGFGTITAAATAAHALDLRFSSIGWHCWANNTGSIRVAENLGFKRAANYSVCINHWAAENITDMSQQEFRAFARSYERRFQARQPASGFPYIVAAKAWALGGNRQGCYRHLHKAVELGWLRGVEQLREIWPEFFWNPELEDLPEWRTLARRLEANGSK